MYKLNYLPIAQKDLKNIINYIANHLKAPQAALNLVTTFDNSISRLQQFPYSCQVYQTVKPLKAEYRMLPVKNYLIFYVVAEGEIEIHRIIYAKRDLENLLK